MPPLYTVRARVIDIRTDTPRPTDALLVDTNVWYWHVYSSAGAAPGSVAPAQMTVYRDYLQDCTSNGAVVYYSGLSLAELAHLIEQNERDIYAGAVAPITTKEYRHNVPAERARVVQEVQDAWAEVQRQSQSLPLVINDAVTNAALTRFATQPVEGYDLFLLEAMSAAGVSQVLTDDGDYCTVSGLEVFTANARVIAAARAPPACFSAAEDRRSEAPAPRLGTILWLPLLESAGIVLLPERLRRHLMDLPQRLDLQHAHTLQR